MRITDTKRNNFINMMREQSDKMGINMKSDYDSIEPSILRLEFEGPRFIRSYTVDFSKVLSLTEAAVSILVDLNVNDYIYYGKLHNNSRVSVVNAPTIKEVIFNPPATIVFWTDGTKTVVKCGARDTYDKEKGLAMAIAKKALGNKSNYYETFKRFCAFDEEEPQDKADDVE